MRTRVERKYHAQDGSVRSAQVLLWDDLTALEVSVELASGVVGWASDWTVDGDVLQYGRNYGPSTYGHTDVVLAERYMDAVRRDCAPSGRYEIVCD